MRDRAEWVESLRAAFRLQCFDATLNFDKDQTEFSATAAAGGTLPGK